MAWEKTSDWSDQAIADWVRGFQAMNVDPLFPVQAAMNESGLYAKAHNPGGASGLIQFMPSTLAGMGWTGDGAGGGDLSNFRNLSAEQQVPWVIRYFQPHAQHITSAALCYVTGFLPALLPEAAAGGMGYVLTADENHRDQLTPYAQGVSKVGFYTDNKGFDHANKGYVTVQDLQDTITQSLAIPANAARWNEFIQRMDLTEGGNGDGSIALGGGGLGGGGFSASLGHALAKFGIGTSTSALPTCAPSHSRDFVVFGLGIAAGILAYKYGPSAYRKSKRYADRKWDDMIAKYSTKKVGA